MSSDSHVENQIPVSYNGVTGTQKARRTSLSQAQKSAVLHGKGPCLVLAGPGSGKTMTIVNRIKYLIKELQTIPDVIINTGGKVSSHIVNFSCIGYKPEVILHALEEKDILISTRSACSSKTSDVSRVMQQLHLPDEVAKSALRVSISDLTKEEEIDKFIYCLKEVLDSIKKQR